MARPERWMTAERLLWLQKVYPLHCIAETCRLFNERFGTDIQPNQMKAANKGHRFGHANRNVSRKYTDEMIDFVRSRYLKYPLKKTAQKFERRFGIQISEPALSNMATKYKFDKRSEYSPNSGQFRKGHKSWNTGMKGLSFGGKATQFKKGNVPHNEVPMWSERFTEKYGLLIKVPERNPYTDSDYVGHFVAKGRWVWEQENGSIPEKHVIIHLDGDPLNCALENLECVPRKTLAFLNSNHAPKAQSKELKPVLVRIAQIRSAIHDRTGQ